MEPVLAYIGIGSNLGDRAAFCRAALRRFAQLPDTPKVRSASLYETEPVGHQIGQAQQGQFLNTVAELTTRLEPRVLFAHCLEIERDLGRTRPDAVPQGPRTLDLDLLLYGDLRADWPDLTIPHPRLADRRFVLVPLAELAPDMIHPSLGRTIQDLLTRLEDAHAVRRIA